MMKMRRISNWILDKLATLCMWLALHLECWRVGHDWQLGPSRAWCERCEDEIKGERARQMFEARYGPYVEPPPPTPWPPINVDLGCPPDMIYMLDSSAFGRLPDRTIVNAEGKTIVPPIPFLSSN